jgi:hypothetical protein
MWTAWVTKATDRDTGGGAAPAELKEIGLEHALRQEAVLAVGYALIYTGRCS